MVAKQRTLFICIVHSYTKYTNLTLIGLYKGTVQKLLDQKIIFSEFYSKGEYKN